MRTLRDRVGAAAPVFGVLLVLLVAIAVVNPSFLEPASLYPGPSHTRTFGLAAIRWG